MSLRSVLWIVACLVGGGAIPVHAVQVPPTGQVIKPPAPPQAAGQVAPKPTSPLQAPQAPSKVPAPVSSGRAVLVVSVTDGSGVGIPEARVTVTGPVVRDGSTGEDGTATFQGMRTGTYRVRFEAPGFITFEREGVITRAVGAPTELDAMLNRAPVVPVEPPPLPPAPVLVSPPVQPPDPAATVDVLSIVDYLASNRLDRSESRRSSVVGRSGGQSTSILQIRDAVRDRGQDDGEEVVYVVNGRGVLISKGREYPLDTGSLVVVPRGVRYVIENRGRDPLWALSVLASTVR